VGQEPTYVDIDTFLAPLIHQLFLVESAWLAEKRMPILSELETYVCDRVKELTDGRQTPVAQKPTTVRSFPIAKH